ncbi:MAG: hypothetical protein MUD17_12700 [Gemmatimonadaceae bacterium]|nr:hypothetical protein [Gemmatimonadaceae bacterium]
MISPAPLLMRLLAPALLVALAAPLAAQPADLIVVNARVYTADDARPLAEAFAVRDGKLTFVGSTREARALAGNNTRVVDLAGQTVIPGMVDASISWAYRATPNSSRA